MRIERTLGTLSIGIAFALQSAWSNPQTALARCKEGSVGGQCSRNGCPGVRECVDGAFICDAAVPCPRPPQPDTLTLLDAPFAPVGFMFDGLGMGAEIDDKAVSGSSSSGGTLTFKLGQIGASNLGNEVLAFGSSRAPTRFDAPWTAGVDNVTARMEPSVRVPITLWIVVGPFATENIRALSAASQAGALFEQERVGLNWSALTIRDATQNASATALQNITGANFRQLETQIGHDARQINVYWVASVNGGAGNGLSEVANGDTVAVGRSASGGLLAHEIGHNLALDHVDGDARFGTTNVMQSNGGSRQFMTEGQAYRAHIRTISAIRSTTVYGLRTNMPLIDTCDINAATRTCPRADKRVWADGTFPPN